MEDSTLGQIEAPVKQRTTPGIGFNMKEYRGIGYQAKLCIATLDKDGLTVPTEIFYSAPYKLTNYFRLNNGGIEYILMNASAGIMARDNYHTKIDVGDKTKLVLSSQSFEKIHDMDGGVANRVTLVNIGNNAYFKYIPLPTIPFAGSAFNNVATINLKDKTSQMIYAEVLSCGRYLGNESFGYVHYKSLIDIYQTEKLVYRDRNVFIPKEQKMECFGLFESYSHLSNIIIFGLSLSESIINQISNLFNVYKVDGGITTLLNDGYLIRAFANGSEALIKCFTEIITSIEQENNLTN